MAIYHLLRHCTQLKRADFFAFLTDTVFPDMAKPAMVAHYPGAAAMITAIETDMTHYGTDHSNHHTLAARADVTHVKDGVGLFISHLEANGGNDPTILEQTGFPIAILSGQGTPDPVTGQVKNVVLTPLHAGKFVAEYEADKYAHFFIGYVKAHGAPDSDYKEAGYSQSHTMYFGTSIPYTHATDYDVKIVALGTKGRGLESEVGKVLVD